MSMNRNLEQQLREEARRSGLNMLTLSKRASLGYAIVHGFLTGDRVISIRSAAKLAAVLGLELRPVRRGKRKGR